MPVPIEQLYFQPDQNFRHWLMSQIYNGNENLPGRIVPNVNDLITDYDQGFFKVVDVDMETGISAFEEWSPPLPNSNTGQDILLGTGPGLKAESFRIFINNLSLPRSLTFDGRLTVNGSTCSHVKVFLGTDVTSNGTVISAWYDQNMAYAGENIPLEVVQHPFDANVAVKAPLKGWCNRPLPDNEQVTVVTYDSSGVERGRSTVAVINSDFTRPSEAYDSYVISIALKSGYLSDTNSNTLSFPANITNHSAHIMCEVTYNNRVETFPVDGVKASVYGLSGYIPTVVGQRVPVVLAYHMGIDEYSSGSVEIQNNNITELYYLETIESDNAYSLKLFAYPSWINPAAGYEMEYWLYSLERERWYYATPWVSLHPSSVAFNPTSYGTVQNLILRLNVNSVDPDYFTDHVHTQNIGVTLRERGDISEVPNWTIAYTPGQNPQYGVDCVALVEEIAGNVFEVDISCNAVNIAGWLETTYYRTQPMILTGAESTPPVPTHVILKFSGFEYEISVNQWNSTLTLPNDLLQGELLHLAFIKRDGMVDRHLAMAALPVHIVPN